MVPLGFIHLFLFWFIDLVTTISIFIVFCDPITWYNDW